MFSFEELNEILGQFSVEYEDYSNAESNVRKIIESYCNQKFVNWFGDRLVDGYEGHIILPEVIESIDSVWVYSDLIRVETPNIDGYVISENGQSIFNPERDRTVSFFRQSPGMATYKIKGMWGYSGVPANVHFAALELARNFLCDDIEYRRRYLQSIKNNDIRIEFAKSAYSDTTGNPIADEMLEPYRFIPMGAV